MAFGTGLHPTTRLCIVALEEVVQPGDSVLDIGCGSGVLAIATHKLGATRLLAADIDPIAVDATLENAQLNRRRYWPKAARWTCSWQRVGMAGQVRVLVANILAEVIARLFNAEYGYPPLAEPLAADGVMILSGILDEHAPIVEATAHATALRSPNAITKAIGWRWCCAARLSEP